MQHPLLFFSLYQALWKHFIKYSYGGKNTYSINRELLFDIRMLCFIYIDNIEIFYNKIKKKFKVNKYKMFFYYYSKT